MKILLASDHAGYSLKEKLIAFLVDLGYEPVDKGAFDYNEDDDYPDFIAPVAEAVSRNPEGTRAIILGGSGQGEAMIANRYPGVRAAVYYGEPRTLEESEDLSVIKLSREHNNANVLSLGARFLTEADMQKAVKEWLDTSFNNEERHERRLGKLENNHA